jgi:SAM-dependent methyltransferase
VVAAFPFTEQLTKCDLCGNQQLLSVDPEAKVVRCQVCGYRFVNPRPTQQAIADSYSAADFYDGWIEGEAGRRRMWAKRLSLFRRRGANLQVLDIGAGIGTFLAMGRDELGWKVTGTEVSSSAVQRAAQRHGLKLLLGNVEDLNLPNGSFDLITVWHVLEHLPSPAATLELCHKLLVANGRLAIAVPNDNDERWWLLRTKARLRITPKPVRYDPILPGHEVHLSHFQSRVLTRALQARGFAVDAVTVDDHHAQPSRRTDALVRTYRLINSATGLNFGQAMLVLARKKG